ncbi:N-acetylneuraminate synthase [Pseudidiomarina planktonica]|uniref:N-acetylneuraminate synthase n=1 Tax=Pseudidiomarina planktonica TaxID=1323738 RepID=A0A1Y6EMF3_9GAMM|nr:pseudaminic acid synthase [Pseudidiomarina planktonica]RUO65873.1 pseudaminic acid synthase [Pseudidiomarina planktonica]SMQ62140.1 N-acetylneuraminate synthase [Pseudidiomarina planktonica]
MRIAQHSIGAAFAPFVIAEISGNHGGDYNKALALIEAAAAAGCQAVKLQTYTADTMTLPVHTGDFYIENPDSLWHGQSLHQLYEQAMTPWEWHQPLFKRAQDLGMVAFSSPFDASAVEFLETLNVPCYKVASFENTDHALLQAVAATGKPIIMSTGMASLTELSESVTVLREAGCKDLLLLKCTSNYPAAPVDANLKTIAHLRELFGCEVGLSDHTRGFGAAVTAVAMGGSVIEKHFVLDRSDDKAVDAAFSLEPVEMKQLVAEITAGWQSLGQVRYGPTDTELPARKHRRSLYISADVQAGETLTEQNVRSVRPGLGLPCKYLPQVLGRKVTRAVTMGTALSWDLLGEPE